MGTFIVAFIGNGFVSSTQKSTALKFLNSRPMLRRRLLVLMYFSGIVSVVFLFGVMTIPDIIREGADFVRRLKSENVWVVVLEKMRNGLGYGLIVWGSHLCIPTSEVSSRVWQTSGIFSDCAVGQQWLTCRLCSSSKLQLRTALISFLSRGRQCTCLQTGQATLIAHLIHAHDAKVCCLMLAHSSSQ